MKKYMGHKIPFFQSVFCNEAVDCRDYKSTKERMRWRIGGMIMTEEN
jgi:hypothetical protein